MVSKATPGCVQYAETRSHLHSPECFLDKCLNWTSLEKPVNKKTEEERETHIREKKRPSKHKGEERGEAALWETGRKGLFWVDAKCLSPNLFHLQKFCLLECQQRPLQSASLLFTCLFSSTPLGICFINTNHTFVQYKLCPTQEQGKTLADGDKETVLCMGSWLKCSLPWRLIQS